MNTLREAAQQALEAMEYAQRGRECPSTTRQAITALRAALAQQAEPLNLRDPAVQKRLATQWGYVQQGEPLTNQCGETCERAKLCATCARALDEPAQEPVAWRTFDGEGGYEYRAYEDNECYAAAWAQRNPRHVGWVEPLYTAPPRRTMVPLTEEDLGKLYADWYKTPAAGLAHFARAVEKAIWEKNK